MRSVSRSVTIFMWAFVVCALLLKGSFLFAQLTRGGISGTVRDESEAAVPNAQVTITQLDTNLSRTITTNDSGFYRATALEPGTYSVVIKKDGFEPVENRAIVVNIGQEVTFNIGLKIGPGAAVVVDVSSQTSEVQLNKTSPTLSLSTTARQVVELPLAGRNINNLALLAPNTFSAPGSSGIAANGQRARNNNFTIDGSDNNDIGVTIPTIPIIPEAVAEFQIQTNPYSAELGRNSGAQINVITRGGTNQFRGDAWEVYNGSGLSALDNQEKQAGLTRPARFNRNQFGFDAGGPIKKDRTFFFGLVQWDRTRSFTLGPTVRIPTPAGFAALRDVPLRNGQTLASRQAMLDALGFLNGIYAQRPVFNSILRASANGVPIETGNINLPISAPNNTWNGQWRVDHQIRPTDNFTGRYAYHKVLNSNVVSNLSFGSLFAGSLDNVDQNLALSETHIFSSSLVNEFRFSFIRRKFLFPENDPRTPTTSINNFSGFIIGGAATFPQGRIQNSFQYSDTMSWQRGRHAVKFGADIRRIQLQDRQGFNTKGTFAFSNIQDYLNNSAFSFVQTFQPATIDPRQTQQFYFVQDDLRLTPNLTMNLGLRYELSGVPFGFFGATDPQILAALVPGPVKTAKRNFGPSFGFAYSPRATGGWLGKLLGDGKSVLRGGYAIKYDILFYNILSNTGTNYPRAVSVQNFNVVDQFPRILPSAAPIFNPLATFVNVPSDARNPYAQLFSLSFQREMYRDFVLEAGYTGSLSHFGLNQGQANPAILTPEQAATVRATGNPNSIPSTQQRRLYPQFGSRPLLSTTANAAYNAGFISLNKRMSKRLQFGIAYTYSKYMSDNDEPLAVASVTGASPQIPQDYFNVRADRSVSVFDRTHRFVTNYTYEIPWFHSGVADHPVIRNIFNGWQISGITTFQAGQPFTIITGVDSNGNGTATGDRPNFNPSGTLTPDPVTGNLRTFTTSGRFLVPRGSDGQPLANSLGNGNLGKNTLRGPGLAIFNLAISKSIKWGERQRLIFRTDLFDAFNHPTFGNPSSNMNSLNFGNNLNNWGNRTIQLSAKYSF